MPNFLTSALKFARGGFPVFPVAARGKAPLTENGLKDATTDERQINRWWSKWPDANIAMATGHGMVVLDIDVDADRGVDGYDSLRLWESEFEALPETWMVLTGGGGIHYYFKTDKEIRNRTGVLPGVDVRGDGGYVIVPPSIHPNGRAYEWEAVSFDYKVPVPLPEDLYALMVNNSTRDHPKFELPERIPEGERNDTLFRYAASLQGKGRTDFEIMAIVQAANDQCCDVPLKPGEVETLVNSALRYDKGEDQAATTAESKDTLKKVAEAEDVERLLSRETFDHIFAIKDPFEREKQIAKMKAAARSLKVTQSFNNLLRAHQKERAMAKKQAESQDIQFTDPPIKGLKCGEWIAEDSGIYRCVEKNSGDAFKEYACSHPVIITERLCNIDTETEKLTLAFLKDDKWQTLIVERSTLASRTKVIELADRGIAVNSENAKAFIRYLADLESLNLDKIPAYQSIDRMGWIGTAFSPYVKDIRFDGDAKNREIFEAVTEAGDYETWKTLCQSIRQTSVIGKIMLAASFASCLIEPMAKLPFFVHLWGGTEAGKTVALMLAASVWGNPAVGKLTRSFNATLVGLERAAAFNYAIPLVLDELQTIKDSYGGGFDKIVYNLCEGQGKIRGLKGGGIERMNRWKNVFLSSGEQPLSSDTSGGGAKNRCVEIGCKTNIFENARTVADTVQGNYGFAGKRFVQFLQNEAVFDLIRPQFDAFYDELIKRGSTEKQCLAGAMLLFADMIAADMIFEDGAPLTVEELGPFLTTREEIDVAARAHAWILAWIASNQFHFQKMGMDGRPAPMQENIAIWGRVERDGYTSIIGSRLAEDIEKAGFSYRAVLSALADRDALAPSGGKNTCTVRINGCPVRCVRIKTNQTLDGEQISLLDDPDFYELDDTHTA